MFGRDIDRGERVSAIAARLCWSSGYEVRNTWQVIYDGHEKFGLEMLFFTVPFFGSIPTLRATLQRRGARVNCALNDIAFAAD